MTPIVRIVGSLVISVAAPLAVAQPGPIDIPSLHQRMLAACPALWEDIKVDIDPANVSGDHFAGSTTDRQAFMDFVAAEMGAAAPDAAGLAAMADDLPTVAAECATQRLGLLDGLINKLPNDALAALAAVSEEMQASQPGLDADGFLVGDIRITGRSEPAEGWLFLVGQSIGNTGSGADVEGEDLEALHDLAKGWAPNLGSEDFANGDIVVLPDMRGRVIAGTDNMGGNSANRLTAPEADQVGGHLGAESHQLTVNEMPAHSHGMGAAGNHNHGYTDVSTVGGSSLGSGGSRGDATVNRTTATAGNHSHAIQSTGGDQAHPIVQPTVLFHVEMKYL